MVIIDMSTLLSIQDVKDSLPAGSRIVVEQSLVDKLNNVHSDPIIAKEIRNNFLSYSKVVKDGRYKVNDYLNAITYATHKSRGLTNKDAYILTFPNRYQNLLAQGCDDKKLSSYVAGYNSNSLVQLILEQSLIPIRLMNRDAQQIAIDTLVECCQTAKYDRDRVNAANSLLLHLKEPEKAKLELEIGLKDNPELQDLKHTLSELANTQLNMINQGVSTKTIAHQKIVSNIIDTEIEDI